MYSSNLMPPKMTLLAPSAANANNRITSYRGDCYCVILRKAFYVYFIYFLRTFLIYQAYLSKPCDRIWFLCHDIQAAIPVSTIPTLLKGLSALRTIRKYIEIAKPLHSASFIGSLIGALSPSITSAVHIRGSSCTTSPLQMHSSPLLVNFCFSSSRKRM